MPLISSGSRLIRHAATKRWLAGGIPAANCLAAYEPMDAASQAASYTNLANPGTYDCTLGAAPSWAAGTGWTGAANAYLKTGLAASSITSAIVRLSGFSGNNGCIFGAWTFAPDKYYDFQPSYNSKTYWERGGSANITGATASGVLAHAAQVAYLDGVNKGTIPAGNGIPSIEIYLLAVNSNGTASNKVTGSIQRAYFYNIDIASYISALQTSINS